MKFTKKQVLDLIKWLREDELANNIFMCKVTKQDGSIPDEKDILYMYTNTHLPIIKNVTFYSTIKQEKTCLIQE